MKHYTRFSDLYLYHIVVALRGIFDPVLISLGESWINMNTSRIPPGADAMEDGLRCCAAAGLIRGRSDLRIEGRDCEILNVSLYIA